jgi:hypothetical protein
MMIGSKMKCMAGPELGDRIAREERVRLHRGENIGLQGRFLIGHSFINPYRAIGRDVVPTDISISDQTYRPVEALSTLERAHTWRGRLWGEPETQRLAWADDVVAVMDRKKDFFEAETGKKYKNLYMKLGIDLDDFDQEKAIAFYNRFFTQERRGKEVESFIGDILGLDIYQIPGGGGAINLNRIREDLDAYAWLGTIFGRGSNLVISELLVATAKVSSNKEKTELVKDLNRKEGKVFRKKRRVDYLYVDEAELLNYTNSAFQAGELKPPIFVQQRVVEPPPGDDFLPPAPPLPPPPPPPPAAPIDDETP